MNTPRKILDFARRHKIISLALVFAFVYALRFFIIYLARSPDDVSGETTVFLEYVLILLGAALIGLLGGLIFKKPRKPRGDSQQH